MKKQVLSIMACAFLFSCGNVTSTAEDPKSTPPAATLAQPAPPKSEGVKRVLLIGNSHTEFFVSLPDLLQALCKENGQQVEVDKLLEMGVSIQEILAAHQADAAKMFALTDKDGNYYDYIILQEKTPVALTDLEEYKANCKKVVDMLKANSPGAAVYIYELMSPAPYSDKGSFDEAQKELLDNASEVAQSLPNTGVLHIGDKIAEAYAQKNGYAYMVNGKDALRFGGNTLHMLNDAGFLSSIYIYKTIFGANPKIPAQLPLSTGTGDNGEIKNQEVSKVISNPAALEKIAEG